MSGDKDHNESELRPLVAAAAWRVHFAETGEATSEVFEAWLAADPENRAAWAVVEDSWGAFGQGAGEFEVLAATRDARNTLSNSRLQYRRAAAPYWKIAAAATLIVGAAAAGGMLYWQQKPLDYKTAYNQHDTITLADGSKIMLDSSTELRVRARGNIRNLELVRGQARFKIVHDPARPLYVHVGSEKIIDIGTDFNVDRPGRAVVVTLIEGRVAVANDQARSKPVELHPGEQLSVSSAHKPKVANVDVSRVTAWQSGELMFDNEPLSAVVQRINRYSAQPIIVADAKAGAMRVSGVFRAGDTQGFLHMVTNYLPVSATAGENGRIRLTSRN
jgi:transmembrane sensor